MMRKIFGRSVSMLLDMRAIKNLRAGGGGHIREDAVLISGESEIKGLVWVPQKRNPIPKK